MEGDGVDIVLICDLGEARRGEGNTVGFTTNGPGTTTQAVTRYHGFTQGMATCCMILFLSFDGHPSFQQNLSD